MATDKQAEHLERAREAREKNQVQLRRISELEAQVAAYEEVGEVFHDDSMSYTQHAGRIVRLRSDWPELKDILTKLFGLDKYDR